MEGELRTVGTVTELNGNKAKVVFTRSKACGDCHACVSFGSDQAETELANTLGAKVGDRVMYGIPLVALLAGVLIGSFISDLFTAVFGIGAAVIAFLIIRLFEPKFKKMGKFDPRMIEIVSE